jgi:uncharacterized protein with GYD domain
VQLAYTSEAWAAQIANPSNRVEAVRPILEQVGGRFVGEWFAFGEYDIVFVMETPDNQAASACAFAVTAGGAVRSYKTTPLMPIEEGIAAMKKAGELSKSYKPPAG